MGANLASLPDLGLCAADPVQCIKAYLTGNTTSAAYAGWITSQGIPTGDNSQYGAGIGAGAFITAMLTLGAGGGGDAATAAEGSSAAGARLFTSADPHVADAANAIQSAMPGRVLGVNQLIPMTNGLSREADINLGDMLVQVKSGNARGLIGQIQDTEATTGIPTVGYGPSMPAAAWEGTAWQGIPIARSIDELIAIIRELG
jgi:hypothetical protein